MTTPSYFGSTDQLQTGGLLGRLSSYFGGSGTPPYAGVGQPASNTGPLGGTTPMYAAPPQQRDPVAPTCSCATVAEQETTSCPIDPEALAAGQIAIVIPRQGA